MAMEEYHKRHGSASQALFNSCQATITWDNGRWTVRKDIDAPRADRATALVENAIVSEPRDPQKVHWIVVGNSDGHIPVWWGEASSSRLSKDRLSTGAIVEQLELNTRRLRFRLREGYGPRTGWTNTHMDGADLLVREDEHTAYMKNRVTFSGGRWTPTPLPWVPWTPPEVMMLQEYRWTATGIDALKPAGLSPGDVFTAKHLRATHTATRRLECSDLEGMGFIEAAPEVESQQFVWTGKGLSAILASNQGTLNYEKVLAEWGNPSAGAEFTPMQLWQVRKQAGDGDGAISLDSLAAAGYIERKLDAALGDAAAEDASAEDAAAEDAGAEDAAA
mmetsp:Transcript_62015/g.174835  ORF Transcript_62015/g.174835 Transcript_62015/m.174835 type:complete len:334 (-) Transcript_62015:145-1146(-)